MRPWLIDISLAVAIVVALTQLLNAMAQFVNALDRLLLAIERLAGRIRNIVREIRRTAGLLRRYIPRRVTILAVSALLVVLVWLPWLR